MLKRLIKIALYVVPALAVLAAFAFGHLILTHKSDRLETYRLEHGLIPPPEPKPEPEPAPASEAAPDTPPPETTPEGLMIPPSYHYFSFMRPFTGNVGDTKRLFSLEISVSIFDTPLRTERMLLRLTELEAQMRPYVLEVLEGISEDDVRSGETRKQIETSILDALNAAFKDLGEEITLKSAMITNFILT